MLKSKWMLLFLMAWMSNGWSVSAQTYPRGEYSFEVAPIPEWVVRHDIPNIWTDSVTGAQNDRWRNWLLDEQVDRRANGHALYVEHVYEPILPELLTEAGKFQVSFQPEFQHLVIHEVAVRRAGTWQSRLDPDAITLARRETEFEKDMATGTVTALLVLKDIRINDLIRVSYSIVGDNPILERSTDEKFLFSWTDPILDRYARVLFDRGARLNVYRGADAPAVEQHQLQNMLEVIAKQHGIKAVPDEGSYPLWYERNARVIVSEKRSWQDVANWARKLYPTAQALPQDLQDRIAEWRRLPTLDTQIGAALRSVQEDVRYFGVEMGANSHKPSEPAETWKRRYGDCKDKARLLATILSQLGVTAYPALVSSNHGRAIAHAPPAASVFDHVIVQARLGRDVLWLDPTMTQQRGPVRILPHGDFGIALPIAPDTKDLVEVPPSDASMNKVRIVQRYTPKPDGTSVSLRVESDMRGAPAERMRRYLKSQSKEALTKNYADFFSRRFGDVAATDLNIDDSESENRLRLIEQYELKNPWRSSTPAERVLEVAFDSIANEVTMPKGSERNAPFATHDRVDIEDSVEFPLPQGWRWTGDAGTKTLEDAAMHFDYEARLTSGTLRVTQRYNAQKDVVDASEFPAHFRLLRQINDASGWRIPVALPARDADHQRSERLKNLLRDVMDQSPNARKD